MNAETDSSKLMEEEFFMGMRKCAGIDLIVFKEKWRIDPLEGKGDMISELTANGFIILEDDNTRLRFTPRGFLVSNEILQKFLG